MSKNMKKTLLSTWGLLLGTILAYGQATISPAPPQTKPVIITGATIHVGNGQVINNGYIAFDKGESITAIVPRRRLPIPTAPISLTLPANKYIPVSSARQLRWV